MINKGGKEYLIGVSLLGGGEEVVVGFIKLNKCRVWDKEWCEYNLSVLDMLFFNDYLQSFLQGQPNEGSWSYNGIEISAAKFLKIIMVVPSNESTNWWKDLKILTKPILNHGINVGKTLIASTFNGT